MTETLAVQSFVSSRTLISYKWPVCHNVSHNRGRVKRSEWLFECTVLLLTITPALPLPRHTQCPFQLSVISASLLPPGLLFCACNVMPGILIQRSSQLHDKCIIH